MIEEDGVNGSLGGNVIVARATTTYHHVLPSPMLIHMHVSRA